MDTRRCKFWFADGRLEIHDVDLPCPEIWWLVERPDVPEFVDFVGDKLYPMPRLIKRAFHRRRFAHGGSAQTWVEYWENPPDGN